jgi:chromosome segregation ATPase
MSDKAASNDTGGPSKLELLRARVHSSRKLVADKQKLLGHRISLDGDSSSLASETLPLHQQQDHQELLEKLRQIEQDRESLQKDLGTVKKELEGRTRNVQEDSQSAHSTSNQAVWEERTQALESINQALKEQSKRDEEAKGQLSSLCETLEQNLEEQAKKRGSSTYEALASLSRELRDAQSRESSLQSEVLSLQSRNDQDARNAKKTEEGLLNQLEEYGKQSDHLAAGMTAIKAADGIDPDDAESQDSKALAENIQDFEQLAATLKQRAETATTGSSVVQELQDQIAAITKEQKDFCHLGKTVVHKLQVKVHTLQNVLSSQMDFRKKLEGRIQELQRQLSMIPEKGTAESQRELQAHNQSLNNLSRQLAESNVSFSALETQVSSLKQELALAIEEAQRNSRLLKEKESALKEASQRNEGLTTQLQLLETEIQHLRDAATTENPAAEMELLMELQDVRQRMDQLTQESSHWKALLEEEQTRDSDLSHEVEELKATISKLESAKKLSVETTAIPEDAADQDDMGLLKQMKVFQVKIHDLITHATTKSQDDAKQSGSFQSRSEVLKLLTELQHIRVKVDGLITTLEKEQADFPKASSPRQRFPGEMDIRITNEMTGRFKDLVVLASPDLTLYEAVYNNSAVKLSDVRKWPNGIAQAAEQKRMVIECVLLDGHGNGVKTFTGQEMKKYSTKDFSSLVADPLDLITLVLRWCEEGEAGRLKSVRISNEVTGRMKEMIVPISDDVYLFDSIYNHDAVRAAAIRKWPNALCEEVSRKTYSIRCVLVSEGSARKSFSADDLKDISTKQLIDLVTRPEDVIQLVLKCQKVEPDAPAIDDKATGRRSRLSLKHTDFAEGSLPDASDADSLTYMHARVSNETTGRFQGLVLPVSEEVKLYDAMYESDALRLARIRRWPDGIAEKVKANAAEIKCALVDEDDRTIRTFGIDELKDVSTHELAGLVARPQDLYRFVLRCQVDAAFEESQAVSDKNTAQDEETKDADTNATFKPRDFRQRGQVPGESPTAVMRMQISNQTTKRSKDVVVPISTDLNLFDGVYSNASVREAKIRKWPTEVAQAVKRNVSEIKIAVLDGDDDIRVFSVEALKLVSTKQLAELVPKSDEVISVVLRWQKTPAEEVRELKAHINILETEKQDLEGTMESMKMDHTAKLAAAEEFAVEQRQSVNSVTTELAAAVANQSIAEMKFAETKNTLESALAEKTRSLDEANMNLVRFEGEVKHSRLQNSGLASLEIPNMKFRINGLEHEKANLMKLIEENPLQEQLRDLQVKLDNAVAREATLKEDLDAYKIRLHQQLHGATANESSTKAELRLLKNRLQEEFEAAKSRESNLQTEVISYKEKLQQERYMLSCLSTELYGSSHREAELREAVDHLEAMSKHDTVHTEETAVQIVDAEYAGEAPQDSLQVELDSARNMNEVLSVQVQELQNQIEKLEHAHANKEKQYKHIMERDEEMKASITSLTSILEQTTDSNKMLSARVEELEARSANLKKEKEDLFQSTGAAEKESQEQSRLLTEATDLKTKLAFANADKLRISNLLEQKERIIANLHGASENYDSQERNRDVLAMLEKSHQREKKLQVQYRVCVSELEKLTESSKTYQETTEAKLSATQKEVDEQKCANKLLKGIIAKLNQMNESLEEEYEKQGKELDYLRSQNREISQTKLGDLQSINGHLTGEVTFLREQKTKFTRTVAKLTGQLQQMAKQKTEGDMEKKRLEAVIGELEEEKKQGMSRDDQLDSAQQKVVDLTRKLKQEREERARESEEARDQDGKFIEEVQSLKEQITELRQKLGDPLRAEKTDVLVAKVRDGEATSKKLKKERNALRTELDDVSSRMAQIKQEILWFGF